jgi:large subunit ribosomal protein L22
MADFQVRAVTKYTMGSPLKARRVVNVVRGMPALQALEVLALMPQKAADVVAKTVKSAVANAEENYGLDANDLVIVEITANEGPRLRRIRFGARGRVKPIRKRTSHITVVLEEREEEAYFGS